MSIPSITDLIPRPLSVLPAAGRFVIERTTRIVAAPGTLQVAALLSDYFAVSAGFRLVFAEGERPSAGDTTTIALAVDEALSLNPEAYQLVVSPARVVLTGATNRGLICGVQTLRQLLPPSHFSTRLVENVRWELPCGTIEDRPRFGWRGMMLDSARHFMPIDFIYKWIDLLSLHKLNVFHWHLTEDQGWRIEIKKYPRLTEIGAWRKSTLSGHALPFRDAALYSYDDMVHGGFYTQDQIRAIVAYAEARNVTIVPEIEMPGHAQAAIAAYPHLGNLDTPLEVWNHWGITPNIVSAEDATVAFFKDVLTEVMSLFPSTFIHIGGDEAPKDQWVASPSAQARIKELGLLDENELQSWFIRQMDDFLAANGRRLIGWDEILEGGLAPGATVMSWRGDGGGIAAARAGHDVVMAPHPHVYFDQYQTQETDDEPLAIGGFNPIENVHAFEPIPASLTAEEARHILGAQAQVWTEYMPTPRDVERMAFPRACALAEVLWSEPKAGRFEEFANRLRVHAGRLDAMGVRYHGAPGSAPGTVGRVKKSHSLQDPADQSVAL